MQSLRRVGVMPALTGGQGGVRMVSNTESRKPKTGILMLNMGGPRDSSEVQQFLTNLFADRSTFSPHFTLFIYILQRHHQASTSRQAGTLDSQETDTEYYREIQRDRRRSVISANSAPNLDGQGGTGGNEIFEKVPTKLKISLRSNC